jgi:DNA-binding CsgD family transcriptional regulator
VTDLALVDALLRNTPLGMLLLSDARVPIHADPLTNAIKQETNAFRLDHGLIWTGQRDNDLFKRAWNAASNVPQRFLSTGGSSGVLVGVRRRSICALPGMRQDVNVVTLRWPLGDVVDRNLLRSSFALTPAECRLAASLLASHDLATSANDCGITIETARTYLKRLFAKTGTTRQPHLLALLADVAFIHRNTISPQVGCPPSIVRDRGRFFD